MDIGWTVVLSELVLLECPYCGEQWEVVMYYEYGGWLPCGMDDTLCPNCRAVGEEA